MGQHYRADVAGGPLGFVKSLYTNSRMCQWVEPSAEAQGRGKGILFYRNQNGIGTKPIKMGKSRSKVAMSAGGDD